MPRSGKNWFKMNEPSGNTLDSKGSQTGTPVNITRELENGYKFNGDSYVQMNNPILPVNAFSVYMEIKRGGHPFVESREMIFGNITGFSHYGVKMDFFETGEIEVLGARGISEAWNFAYRTSYNPVLKDENWHKILITWDGTTAVDSVKLYIDDMLNSIKLTVLVEPTAPNNLPHLNNLRIGNRFGNEDRFFTGSIRNFQVYTEVIDPVAKFNLIQDAEGIKTLDDNSAWVNIGSVGSILEQDFENHGMIDISRISQESLKQLKRPYSVLMWTDSESAKEAELGYTYEKHNAKTIEITTDPFSPMDKLNQEDEFEVLTWTGYFEIENKQTQGTVSEIDQGKLFETTLEDFIDVASVEIV